MLLQHLRGSFGEVSTIHLTEMSRPTESNAFTASLIPRMSQTDETTSPPGVMPTELPINEIGLKTGRRRASCGLAALAAAIYCVTFAASNGFGRPATKPSSSTLGNETATGLPACSVNSVMSPEWVQT